VAPSWMVSVSASVNLPLHHKVQKFSSGTGSPGWSRKKGRKMVVRACVFAMFICICFIFDNKSDWLAGVMSGQTLDDGRSVAGSKRVRQWHTGNTYTMSQKVPRFYFLITHVNNQLICIIFGKHNPEQISRNCLWTCRPYTFCNKICMVDVHKHEWCGRQFHKHLSQISSEFCIPIPKIMKINW